MKCLIPVVFFFCFFFCFLFVCFFLGKIRNIINLSSAELSHRVVKIKLATSYVQFCRLLR